MVGCCGVKLRYKEGGRLLGSDGRGTEAPLYEERKWQLVRAVRNGEKRSLGSSKVPKGAGLRDEKGENRRRWGRPEGRERRKECKSACPKVGIPCSSKGGNERTNERVSSWLL